MMNDHVEDALLFVQAAQQALLEGNRSHAAFSLARAAEELQLELAKREAEQP